MTLERKSEFAQRCNVSASRVSQWIAEGKIPADALHGEGRMARIRVERAMAALKTRLDLGQRFGNGLATRLDAAGAPAALQANDLDERIKAEKLREVRMRNEDRERERAIAAGRYVPVENHRGAVSRVARVILDALEHEMPELAHRLATRTGADARTVRHELRDGMSHVRSQVADRLDAAAADLPERLETSAVGRSGEDDDGPEEASGAFGGPADNRATSAGLAPTTPAQGIA